MNAILLGAASLGALVTFLTADIPDQTASLAPGEGSMTTDISVDPATDDETEIRVIAFLD